MTQTYERLDLVQTEPCRLFAARRGPWLRRWHFLLVALVLLLTACGDEATPNRHRPHRPLPYPVRPRRNQRRPRLKLYTWRGPSPPQLMSAC